MGPHIQRRLTSSFIGRLRCFYTTLRRLGFGEARSHSLGLRCHLIEVTVVSDDIAVGIQDFIALDQIIEHLAHSVVHGVIGRSEVHEPERRENRICILVPDFQGPTLELIPYLPVERVNPGLSFHARRERTIRIIRVVIDYTSIRSTFIQVFHLELTDISIPELLGCLGDGRLVEILDQASFDSSVINFSRQS